MSWQRDPLLSSMLPLQRNIKLWGGAVIGIHNQIYESVCVFLICMVTLRKLAHDKCSISRSVTFVWSNAKALLTGYRKQSSKKQTGAVYILKDAYFSDASNYTISVSDSESINSIIVG